MSYLTPDVSAFIDSDGYAGISVLTDAATISTFVKDRDHYPLTPDEMVDLARELLVIADTVRRRALARG